MPEWYADNAAIAPVVFMTRMRPKIHNLGLAGLAVVAAALAGCATAPPPIQLMDRAQSEIHAARNAGAASTAPDALSQAERRLAAAQQFTASSDNDKAADSAAEAEAAAATARARADLAHLNQQIQEKTTLNQSLKADLARRQAAAAAAQQAAMAPPAPASSSAPPAAGPGAAPAFNAPVTLPSIQLGQPASGASSGNPAPAATSGGMQPGGNP